MNHTQVYLGCHRDRWCRTSWGRHYPYPPTCMEASFEEEWVRDGKLLCCIRSCLAELLNWSNHLLIIHPTFTWLIKSLWTLGSIQKKKCILRLEEGDGETKGCTKKCILRVEEGNGEEEMILYFPSYRQIPLLCFKNKVKKSSSWSSHRIASLTFNLNSLLDLCIN